MIAGLMSNDPMPRDEQRYLPHCPTVEELVERQTSWRDGICAPVISLSPESQQTALERYRQCEADRNARSTDRERHAAIQHNACLAARESAASLQVARQALRDEQATWMGQYAILGVVGVLIPLVLLLLAMALLRVGAWVARGFEIKP